jgi:hypothetical protein
MIALFLFLLWAALAYTPAPSKKRLTAAKAEIVIARPCVRIKIITITEVTPRRAAMPKGQQRSNREKKKPKQPKPVAPVIPGTRLPWKK